MRTIDDKGNARLDVTCATYREALSAQLDGEQPPVETALHVAGCAGCADWSRDVPALLRPLRMRPADQAPDLTQRILAAIIGSVPRPSLTLTLSRAALMAIAIAQAFVALVQLGGEAHAQHAAAESGAWNLAVGIAFATAALRPRVAYAVFPMVASLVAVLVWASVRDLSAGEVSSGRVLSHGLIIIGFVLTASVVWLLRRPRRPHADTAQPRTEIAPQPALRGLMPR